MPRPVTAFRLISDNRLINTLMVIQRYDEESKTTTNYFTYYDNVNLLNAGSYKAFFLNSVEQTDKDHRWFHFNEETEAAASHRHYRMQSNTAEHLRAMLEDLYQIYPDLGKAERVFSLKEINNIIKHYEKYLSLREHDSLPESNIFSATDIKGFDPKSEPPVKLEDITIEQHSECMVKTGRPCSSYSSISSSIHSAPPSAKLPLSSSLLSGKVPTSSSPSLLSGSLSSALAVTVMVGAGIFGLFKLCRKTEKKKENASTPSQHQPTSTKHHSKPKRRGPHY